MKPVKRFKVVGSFKAGIEWEKFTKLVECENEKNATEKVLSIIGSNHKLDRNLIRIHEIEEV
ncbi:MAG: 50S ribosomal protein L18Ae [Methermicoccaceae archaeon]